MYLKATRRSRVGRKSRLSCWQAGVGRSGAWGGVEDTGIGTEQGRRGVVDQVEYEIIPFNLKKVHAKDH
jgi:hypothetical protein